MLKNLAILFLISGIVLMPNALLAQDSNPVEETPEAVNLVDKDFVAGKEISYVQGHVEGIDSSCKLYS